MPSIIFESAPASFHDAIASIFADDFHFTLISLIDD
jgi:hypothetical protein